VLRSMVRFEHPRGSSAIPIALPVAQRLYPEILASLFHREETVRKGARWLIAATDDTLADRFAKDLVKRLKETTGDSSEAIHTRIAAIRALGAIGTRAAEPFKALKDSRGLMRGDDIPTRAALGIAILQMVSRETLIEEAEPILADLRAGLDPDAINSLDDALVAETKEVYPKGYIPPSAVAAFDLFKVVQIKPAAEVDAE
jgi:HEAT repeat protein